LETSGEVLGTDNECRRGHICLEPFRLTISAAVSPFTEILIFGYSVIMNQEGDVMKEVVIVSRRGQITLPAAVRRRVGIKEGGAVIIEDRGDELVLKPAAVFEVEMYSDERIAEWDKADSMTLKEKEAVLKKIKRKR
jgi:AbrB family looped-hinge helix DNA binding protein